MVSARLIAEVLDHYHGPPRRKLWLIAWAEHASYQTRAGWCPRAQLAARADVSGPHASRIAAELIAEGVLKRQGGGYRGRAAEYVLAPIAEWVPSANGKGAAGDTLPEFPW